MHLWGVEIEQYPVFQRLSSVVEEAEVQDKQLKQIIENEIEKIKKEINDLTNNVSSTKQIKAHIRHEKTV